MDRLTNKGTRMVNDFREADWYNKLSNLEDLEDELGCPLDVVFKALKEGVMTYDYEKQPVFTSHLDLSYGFYNSQGEELLTLHNWSYAVALKDYGKTWWLKEDRSE